MEKIKKILPGVLFCLLISILSILISKVLEPVFVIEGLTIAIIIGIVYNNTIGTQKVLASGVKFSLKKLLKLGIILLGFNLNLFALADIGIPILISVLLFVPITLLAYTFIGKLFKLDTKLATLLGVGSCICGASAIVAVSEAIDASDDDCVISVSVVSFLGAIGVIVYSLIANLTSISNLHYGVFSGLTLQGVAHAIAASFARGSSTGEIGTLVKMTRVLALVPVSLILSYYFSKQNTKTDAKVKKANFPMYVLYFIIAAIINSTGIIPSEVTFYLRKASSILILIAMTGMGLSVNFKSIVKKGLTALLVSSVLFTVISSISLFLIIKFI